MHLLSAKEESSLRKLINRGGQLAIGGGALNHREWARLVEERFVESQSTSRGMVAYLITEKGRNALSGK
jgi:hypothetical protein